ncbi:hypothetical protein GCM10028796_35790 [Ramlibacter monticola]|uniref:Uncharacterized protein n=1 Tax=Ramlibacter monticola TaxID=1926872 RepID=A0A936Z807_9BURK|nr:hypothetical protein [Ramlibacter monticola]MBL0394466.1 hypothetical protein [Ramlibacter monticola]
MGFFELLDHLLSFAAPALVVALGVTLAAPLVLPRTTAGPGWWARLAINCAAGLAALGAGLWYFGRDGKMATYAALVFAVATVQWLVARAWRS